MAEANRAAQMLDDFVELSDEEEETQQQQQQQQQGLGQDKQAAQETTDGGVLEGPSALETKLASLTRLVSEEDYLHKVAGIREMSKLDENELSKGPGALKAYQTVVEANTLAYRIEDEVARIHGVLTEAYGQRFPELETQVPDPRAYARAVQLIGNESDMARLDLSSVLSPAQSMAVSMTGSRLKTAQLPDSVLKGILAGCAAIEELEDTRKHVLLPFVASRMASIAPGMTALLGSEITAQILGIAGGLGKMVTIPSCNVMVLGKSASALNGFSRVAAMRHFGVLYGCPLVQECLPEHRKKAMRVVAGRVALAARLDHEKDSGAELAGRKWHEEIRGKLEKWHAPPPGKTKRALPVPQTISKKRRGGRRAREVKKRLGMTDVRREANRVNFGEAEAEEYGDSAMGNTFGRLGKEGSGHVRITENVQKRKKIDFAHYKSNDSRSSEAKARQEIMDRLRDDGPSGPPIASASDAKFATGLGAGAQDPSEAIELSNPEALTSSDRHSSRFFSGTVNFKRKRP
ncbi:U4/U6 small nuclear ribonucleoprotein Prp31 [Hondaea fermentalgiana]|uniref:U4/U6 small nuclear ribonucleoprotein Prp31 n=1 Tax=Hondaea fermentalgiana TaxID=2315210 RepID=A0A2R5GD64_9STRA|nr:U4/U6 small nuclear ribonucleoprotein Prp31 [Hondaea fermentalgiana]|eukprot:GBG27668.1 U4/U6 small nuclear ribonucleoprotein Prp31 [Hondaea fermentalgiana]